MYDHVAAAKKALAGQSKQSGLKTVEVRKLSALLFQKVKHKKFDEVLLLCEDFLKEHSWEMKVIAFDWAYRMKAQYRDDTFEIFERWLKEYVRGWGDCDDFCTHAFGELLCRFKSRFNDVLKWTQHQDFWVRRAGAVILILPIRTGKYSAFDPFLISEALFDDEHYLVRKGYGWMLKVYSVKEPKKVYDYLCRHRKAMPRDAFRYAMEKMTPEMKKVLMKRD